MVLLLLRRSAHPLASDERGATAGSICTDSSICGMLDSVAETQHVLLEFGTANGIAVPAKDIGQLWKQQQGGGKGGGAEA